MIDAPNAIGSVLAGHRILRCIAVGGMGAVYEARHMYLGRRVAIKVQHRKVNSDPKNRLRLLGEAVSTQRIDHPGVVQVLDYGQDQDGTSFLVMEYLEGGTLADELNQETPLALDRALNIAQQIASTIAAAHDADIVHRDLKPENIHLVPRTSHQSTVSRTGDGAVDVLADTIVDETGERRPDTSSDASGRHPRVKILDFGVAKFDGDGLISSMHTGLGDLLGTPTYMSPEQCQGSAQVDHRSDIYSLGCVLYEMVCGEAPFTGSVADVLCSHVAETPRPPRAVVPDLPVALESFLLAMLDKNPDRRPQTMATVAEVLASLEPECRRALGHAAAGGDRTGRREQAGDAVPRLRHIESNTWRIERVELTTPPVRRRRRRRRLGLLAMILAMLLL